MTFYDDDDDFRELRERLEDEGYSQDEINEIIDELEENEEGEEKSEFEELLGEDTEEFEEDVWDHESYDYLDTPVIATFFSAEEAEEYAAGAPEGVLYWETPDGEHFLVHRTYED